MTTLKISRSIAGTGGRPVLIPVPHYYIRCDHAGCESECGGYADRERSLADATHWGWVHRNGLDFCPQHKGDADSTEPQGGS